MLLKGSQALLKNGKVFPKTVLIQKDLIDKSPTQVILWIQ